MKSFEALEQIASTSHSDGAAEDGEEYPSHLKDLITEYQAILEPVAGHPSSKLSVAQKNSRVQMDVVGFLPPAVKPENTQSRSSTQCDNVRNGVSVVERGPQWNIHDASGRKVGREKDSGRQKKQGSKQKRRSSDDRAGDVVVVVDPPPKKKRAYRKQKGAYEILEGRDKKQGKVTAIMSGIFNTGKDDRADCDERRKIKSARRAAEEKRKSIEFEWKKKKEQERADRKSELAACEVGLQESRLQMEKDQVTVKVEELKVKLRMQQQELITRSIAQAKKELDEFDNEGLKEVLRRSIVDLMKKRSALVCSVDDNLDDDDRNNK